MGSVTVPVAAIGVSPMAFGAWNKFTQASFDALLLVGGTPTRARETRAIP